MIKTFYLKEVNDTLERLRDKKIYAKDRDRFLLEMLHYMKEMNSEGDYTYYEMFSENDMTIPLKIPVKLLFSGHAKKILEEYEDVKISWSDAYCDRKIYPMHYVSFIALDKVLYHSNNNSFKKIKDDYISIIRYFVFMLNQKIVNLETCIKMLELTPLSKINKLKGY